MDLESLYTVVSELIRKAEILDDLAAPGAREAHLDVSKVEESIAEFVPPTDPEGAVARRGAVRAAVAAGDLPRANALRKKFASSKECPRALQREMQALCQGAAPMAAPAATLFPHAAAKFGMDAIRDLAAALLRQRTPFPTG